MRYARFEKYQKFDENRNVIAVETSVVEIIEEADGFTIGEMFHPDFVADLEKVGDDVQVGWVKAGEVIQLPGEQSDD